MTPLTILIDLLRAHENPQLITETNKMSDSKMCKLKSQFYESEISKAYVLHYTIIRNTYLLKDVLNNIGIYH